MNVVPYIAREELGIVRVTWEAAVSGDAFAPYQMNEGGGQAAVSFSATGSFGSALIELQGSNDDVTYELEADRLDRAVVLHCGGSRSVRDASRYLKPTLTGTGAKAIVAQLICRRLRQPLVTQQSI